MDAGTTVVLADPHAMVRGGLRFALEATGRMTVVGEESLTRAPGDASAGTGRSAIW